VTILRADLVAAVDEYAARHEQPARQRDEVTRWILKNEHHFWKMADKAGWCQDADHAMEQVGIPGRPGRGYQDQPLLSLFGEVLKPWQAAADEGDAPVIHIGHGVGMSQAGHLRRVAKAVDGKPFRLNQNLLGNALRQAQSHAGYGPGQVQSLDQFLSRLAEAGKTWQDRGYSVATAFQKSKVPMPFTMHRYAVTLELSTMRAKATQVTEQDFGRTFPRDDSTYSQVVSAWPVIPLTFGVAIPAPEGNMECCRGHRMRDIASSQPVADVVRNWLDRTFPGVPRMNRRIPVRHLYVRCTVCGRQRTKYGLSLTDIIPDAPEPPPAPPVTTTTTGTVSFTIPAGGGVFTTTDSPF